MNGAVKIHHSTPPFLSFINDNCQSVGFPESSSKTSTKHIVHKVFMLMLSNVNKEMLYKCVSVIDDVK